MMTDKNASKLCIISIILMFVVPVVAFLIAGMFMNGDISGATAAAYGLMIPIDIASENDIFFPASRVFRKAREIFSGSVTTVEIGSKHLPSDETMIDVCKRTKEFIKNA